MIRFLFPLVMLILVWITQIRAQLSLSNILEYQLGNLPVAEPSNLSSLYDQLNISYRSDLIRFDTRFEGFQTQDRMKSYGRLTQKSVSFEDEHIRLTAGNYYHIIGRGLLLRSYEIPGTVVEDLIFRTRYGFYRDMEGIKATYSGKLLELNVLYGRPLNNTLPPTQNGNDLWRPHLLEGADVTFYVSNWQIGGSYLRDNSPNDIHEFGSITVGTFLPFDLQFHGEFAQQFGGENKLVDLSDKTAHALYMSINGQLAALGISFEYKDYNDFQLGFNDPPPLVKEHQYLLLNRNTHTVEPVNETGWQSEFFYNIGHGHLLNFNLAEAVNTLFGNRYVFQEQFIEFAYKLDGNSTIKGFFDRNIEQVLSIDERYTAGIYFDGKLSSQWGTTIDFEYQIFKYAYGDQKKNRNLALLFSVSYAPDFDIGLVAEYSDDPGDLPEGREEMHWIGINMSCQYSQAHLITLFYGKRRGGPACTSGICYEILPFEGIELRLTSNY